MMKMCDPILHSMCTLVVFSLLMLSCQAIRNTPRAVASSTDAAMPNLLSSSMDSDGDLGALLLVSAALDTSVALWTLSLLV